MQAKNLEKALDALKGMKITLFLSDNQLVEGILLNFKQDHIICEVDKDVYYIALQHIQAISKNAKDQHISSKVVTYLDGNYFTNIFKEMKYNWVNINSLSNSAFIGVLTNISKDCIVLINDKEVTLVKKSNISNIYKVIKHEDTDQEVNENQEEQQEPIVDTPIEVMNEKELDKNKEVNFTEKLSGKVKEEGNLPVNEEVLISTHYEESLQPDEQDSGNEEHLLEVIMKQEVAVQEVDENQQEEPIIYTPIEVTNEKEVRKNVVVIFRKQISGIVKKKGDLPVNEEVIISEHFDALQPNKPVSESEEHLHEVIMKQEVAVHEVDENQQEDQIIYTPIEVTNEKRVKKNFVVIFKKQISEIVKKKGDLPVNEEVINSEHYDALQSNKSVSNEEHLHEVMMIQEVAVQEVDENQQEEPIVDTPIEVTNEKEVKKNVVITFRKQISEIAKKKGDLPVNEEVIISEHYDALQPNKPVSENEEHLLEVMIQEVAVQEVDENQQEEPIVDTPIEVTNEKEVKKNVVITFGKQISEIAKKKGDLPVNEEVIISEHYDALQPNKPVSENEEHLLEVMMIQEVAVQEGEKNQQEEPIVDTPIEVTNEKEVKKNAVVIFRKQISEIAKKKGDLPVNEEVIISEHYDALQPNKQVIENEEHLLEVMIQEVAVQEVDENQQEEPIVDTPIEVTNEKEVKKNVVITFRKQISEIAKKKGYLPVNEEVIISEHFDATQLDEGLLSKNEEDSLVMNPIVIEVNNALTCKEQFIPNNSNDNDPTQKILPNTFNRDQHGNKNQKKSVNVNQFLVEDRNTTELKQRFEHRLSYFKHKKKPNIKLEKEKKYTFINKKNEPIKLNTPKIPVRKLSPMEEYEMLEKQYYALMNHAAKMYDDSQRANKSKGGKVHELANKHSINATQVNLQEETMIEKQYYALMKYTIKKYQQLREERKDLDANNYNNALEVSGN